MGTSYWDRVCSVATYAFKRPVPSPRVTRLASRSALTTFDSYDLQIRRHGQVVQDCPGVAACWVDIPGLSNRVGNWPRSWQQFWQQFMIWRIGQMAGAKRLPRSTL